jgi:hypothetical protein
VARGRVRREEGAAAVEFAIVGSVLILILFGILVYGLWLSEYSVMQGAAREGARVAATRGPLTSPNPCSPLNPTASVECRIRQAAGAYDSKLTNMPPTWFLTDPAGNQQGCDPSAPSCCTANTVGWFVTVTWNQTFQGDLLPFVPPLPNNKDVKGVFRCE